MKMKKLLVYGGLAAGVYWLGRSVFSPKLGGLGADTPGLPGVPAGVPTDGGIINQPSRMSPDELRAAGLLFDTLENKLPAATPPATSAATSSLKKYLPAALGIGLGAVLLYVLLRKKRA